MVLVHNAQLQRTRGDTDTVVAFAKQCFRVRERLTKSNTAVASENRFSVRVRDEAADSRVNLYVAMKSSVACRQHSQGLPS